MPRSRGSGARRKIAIILVTEFEGCVVVALPQKAWDKKVAKRVVQVGPFTKPLQLEVTTTASLEARDQAGATSMKIWVGLLSKEVADQVSFDSEGEPDINFKSPDGKPSLPYAEALARVANEHFAFWTHSEGGEDRLQVLERSVQELTRTVQVLLPAALAARPKTRAAAHAPAARDELGSVPGTPLPAGKSKGLAGLDPAVVQAAVQSGISPGELLEVKELLGHQPRQLRDFPAGGAGLAESCP